MWTRKTVAAAAADCNADKSLARNFRYSMADCRPVTVCIICDCYSKQAGAGKLEWMEELLPGAADRQAGGWRDEEGTEEEEGEEQERGC